MKKRNRIITLSVTSIILGATLPGSAAIVGKYTNNISKPNPATNQVGLGKHIPNAAVNQAGSIGLIRESHEILGAQIKDKSNKVIGKVDDGVVDLESGRLLYVIATPQGSSDHIAIAPKVLNPQPTGKGLVATIDENQLKAGPKVDLNNTDLGNGAFFTQVYQAYQLPLDFEANGSFQNAHKLSALHGQTVKDSSNADFAKVDGVVLDFQAARVPFVILTKGATSYPVPPNALTLSGDKANLVTGLDANTLNSAPKYNRGNLQMLANASTATAIYTHYGKQPYFNGAGLSPTSR